VRLGKHVAAANNLAESYRHNTCYGRRRRVFALTVSLFCISGGGVSARIFLHLTLLLASRIIC